MQDSKTIMHDAMGFICDQLDLTQDAIPADRDLKSLGLDSFRIIELVLFLERRTGLTFPDHAYTPDNLRTLDSVVACFMKLRP